MLKLCRVDLKRSEEVFKKIERYKDIVVKELRPKAVILFGSFAKGDINECSDVDIIVIANFKEGFLDRIKLLLDFNDELKLPLEPMGYTTEEFQRMQKEGNRFIQEVLNTGKVLYGMIPERGGQSQGNSMKRFIEASL
ncbi:nucleotidyltransferase domain-containing protein [Candidatus Acetothermia bacterium]|jgi:predicted nucleotidyltransferase|nr:nucleotidyltransferase domain-containing protein [Candidatus Acetothermia bacterium]